MSTGGSCNSVHICSFADWVDATSIVPTCRDEMKHGWKNRATVHAPCSEVIIFKRPLTLRTESKLGEERVGGGRIPSRGSWRSAGTSHLSRGATSRHLAQHVDRFMFQLTRVIYLFFLNMLISHKLGNPNNFSPAPKKYKKLATTASTTGTVFSQRV